MRYANVKRMVMFCVLAALAVAAVGTFPEAAQGQERKALRVARKHAATHARCLGRTLPKRLQETQSVRALRRYINRTWRQMRWPNWRARGAAAWLPLARHAGWPRSTWPMLVAVITRESGGNPTLIDPGSCYVGLMQIGQYHSPRLDFRNPNTNLKYARDMWLAKGWLPWRSTAY